MLPSPIVKLQRLGSSSGIPLLTTNSELPRHLGQQGSCTAPATTAIVRGTKDRRNTSSNYAVTVITTWIAGNFEASCSGPNWKDASAGRTDKVGTLQVPNSDLQRGAKSKSFDNPALSTPSRDDKIEGGAGWVKWWDGLQGLGAPIVAFQRAKRSQQSWGCVSSHTVWVTWQVINTDSSRLSTKSPEPKWQQQPHQQQVLQ